MVTTLADLQAHSQNCEKRLLASSCLAAYPSVRIEQLGPHLWIFMKIDI
jgi:hypothetical protein